MPAPEPAPGARPDEDLPAAEWRTVLVEHDEGGRVGPVSAAIAPGERVLVLGPSGCGKSTLLLALTGFVPQRIMARLEGEVMLYGEPVAERQPYECARIAAQYFQDAEQTLVGMSVEDEIAFALENRGLPEGEILAGVARAMRQVGLPESWAGRRVASLSGGEKQLVAMAGVLAQDTPLMLADEPTANLSAEATERVRALLLGSGRTAIVVDHLTDGLGRDVDRAILLDANGRVTADGTPREVFADVGLLEPLGVRPPLAARFNGLVPPLCHPDALVASLEALTGEMRKQARRIAGRLAASQPMAIAGERLVRLQGADCAPLHGPAVLRGISLEIGAGETIALLGANGAGKSTLAAALTGALPLRGGRREGRPGGLAFQRAETQFTERSALAEIEAALRPAGPGSGDARSILADWNLAAVADRHPSRLSEGQKRRLSIAGLVAGRRFPLIVLDEPLSGLDGRGRDMVRRIIASLAAEGHAVVTISHDLDFAWETCGRSLILADGGLLADGPTRTLLRQKELLARAGLRVPPLAKLAGWLEKEEC